MSIGQGFLTTTPLQLAVMLSIVANGGRVVRPKLLRPAAPEESEDPGQVPAWRPETWQYLRHSLRRVVEAGTGAAAFIPGKTSAGKTGSAEAVKGQKTHSWFVGYTPADQPRLVVVVFAEKAGHGGSVSAPIAGKLFRQFHGLPVDPQASGSATASVPASGSLVAGAQPGAAALRKVPIEVPPPPPPLPSPPPTQPGGDAR